jgi:hypothetical protein
MRRIAFLLISCLLFSACIGSENPLSQPGEYENDSRLDGTWFTQNKNGSGYIHFSHSKEDGWIDIATVGFDEERGLDVDFCKGFTTFLENGKFLNVQCRVNLEKEPSEKYSEFQILNYDITGENELRLRAWNANYVQESIKVGRIRGRQNKFYVTISESTPNLVSFIQESEIDQLFKEITQQDGAGPLYKIQEPPVKSK